MPRIDRCSLVISILVSLTGVECVSTVTQIMYFNDDEVDDMAWVSSGARTQGNSSLVVQELTEEPFEMECWSPNIGEKVFEVIRRTGGATS